MDTQEFHTIVSKGIDMMESLQNRVDSIHCWRNQSHFHLKRNVEMFQLDINKLHSFIHQFKDRYKNKAFNIQEDVNEIIDKWIHLFTVEIESKIEIMNQFLSLQSIK